jgi:hypothetical protein
MPELYSSDIVKAFRKLYEQAIMASTSEGVRKAGTVASRRGIGIRAAFMLGMPRRAI